MPYYINVIQLTERERCFECGTVMQTLFMRAQYTNDDGEKKRTYVKVGHGCPSCGFSILLINNEEGTEISLKDLLPVGGALAEDDEE